MSFKKLLIDAWTRFKAEPAGHPDTLRGLNVNPPPTHARPPVPPHPQQPAASLLLPGEKLLVRRLVWMSKSRDKDKGISQGFFAWQMVDPGGMNYGLIMRNEKWRKEVGAEPYDIVTVTKTQGPDGFDVRHVSIERAIRTATNAVFKDWITPMDEGEKVRNVTISTGGVAVDQGYYWNDDMTTCPRGAKVQLLGDGVASYGIYKGEPFWTHWAPLPKKRPA